MNAPPREFFNSAASLVFFQSPHQLGLSDSGSTRNNVSETMSIFDPSPETLLPHVKHFNFQTTFGILLAWFLIPPFHKKGYKTKVRDVIEIRRKKTLRRRVDEEEHLRIYGGLTEGTPRKF